MTSKTKVNLALLVLMELLVIVQVPEVAGTLDDARARRTLQALRGIRRAVDDAGNGPLVEGDSMEELRAHLPPGDAQGLPMLDGWGHPLRYRRLGPDDFVVASAG